MTKVLVTAQVKFQVPTVFGWLIWGKKWWLLAEAKTSSLLPYLVGGFNPSEKHWSKWESSPNRVENKTYLKRPASYGLAKAQLEPQKKCCTPENSEKEKNHSPKTWQLQKLKKDQANVGR